MRHLLEALELGERGVLITNSPDPDEVRRCLSTLHQQHPETFRRLNETQSGLAFFTAVFGNSRFLSEEILRHPEWLESLINSPDMFRMLAAEEYAERIESALESDAVPSALDLAVFRRREILRILLRDVLAYASLPEITGELSNLADAILDVAYRRIRASLVQRFGEPLVNGEVAGFSVLALGKLGGRELNYSSDIDLMFIYSGNGHTAGGDITNKEFFKKVANQYTDLLSTYTARGIAYRVDLRLRPDGRLGEVCLSLDGAQKYYDTRARDWELQMLIKARVAAGEPGPGRELLEHVQPRIYSSTLDFSAVEAVSVTRERIHEKMAARRLSSDVDVKLTRGGIRDIEFLVQCLQRLRGGQEPWVRQGGTLLALQRLHDKSLLSDAEYSRLANAYVFLRHLEHRLQFDEDRQTHTLPSSRRELTKLAHQMPAGQLGRAPSAEKLLRELNYHLEEVQATYDRVIHSQQPLYYSNAPSESLDKSMPAEPAAPGSSNLMRFLDQRAPGLASTLNRCRPKRGARAFEHFLEKVFDNRELLALLDRNPTLARDVVDIFENSPHFSDQLVRFPEAISDLAHLRDSTDQEYKHSAESLSAASELRRFFREHMLRIQAESVCLSVPIFETLARTSDLADAVICSAYRLAIEQTTATHPPDSPSYLPYDQMMVIAMGRLGMREFDLGSDADLVFVLPDRDAREMQFWTRVAERMIQVITAYTSDGVVFAIDTRLRPNGVQGQLVQTVSAYKDYIANHAEAWEGITYMKSRAVTGNMEMATVFLHELQDVDWRRYGQSGRSRTDLRNMRLRLEREQGGDHPLKAGNGGYYDIDFALMYLRLKSAGIFFRVLNTPERIDVIEKMGHLDRADAAFLRDAATFYRSIDHALRVYSGHAEGKLPNSETHLETLSNLVHRWTPPHLHDQPLNEELEQIRTHTREFFTRLFG